MSRTLAFESLLLLIKILKIDVFKIIQQLALCTTIDKPETSNIHKINQIEQQIEEF
jgi:hypothetical protein